MQTTEYIWFDGKMVPSDQARVHVLTHALHLSLIHISEPTRH